MYLQLIFLSFLFLTNNSLANENSKNPDYAVLKSTYTGVSANGKEEVRLERAITIEIIKIKSKFSLITSTQTYGNIWIPNDYILQESQFRKVKKWNGNKELDIVLGDYEATYKIKKDGSFIYRSFESNGNPYNVTGHLYESNGIYWPKMRSNLSEFEDIFFRLSNGDICLAIFSPCVSP